MRALVLPQFGGVGSFAVQFAKAAGARVLATAGPDNQDTLRNLGADVPIDYTAQNVVDAVQEATGGAGVDAVFETAGENLVARSLPAVHPFGRIATILPPQGELTALYRNNIILYSVFLMRERVRLDEMRPLFGRDQVRPLVDRTLPLEKVQRRMNVWKAAMAGARLCWRSVSGGWRRAGPGEGDCNVSLHSHPSGNEESDCNEMPRRAFA